jgi:hypothetical protein
MWITFLLNALNGIPAINLVYLLRVSEEHVNESVMSDKLTAYSRTIIVARHE